MTGEPRRGSGTPSSSSTIAHNRKRSSWRHGRPQRQSRAARSYPSRPRPGPQANRSDPRARVPGQAIDHRHSPPRPTSPATRRSSRELPVTSAVAAYEAAFNREHALPKLGVRVGGARPRAEPGRPLAVRRARTGAAPAKLGRHVRAAAQSVAHGFTQSSGGVIAPPLRSRRLRCGGLGRGERWSLGSSRGRADGRYQPGLLVGSVESERPTFGELDRSRLASGDDRRGVAVLEVASARELDLDRHRRGL